MKLPALLLLPLLFSCEKKPPPEALNSPRPRSVTRSVSPADAPPVFREPTSVRLPETPLPFIAPADRIRAALASGDDAALQTAASAWFEADPTAARDWLALQPDLSPLQPAISSIASRIADSGHPAAALEWAALLGDPDARDATRSAIYATGLRTGSFTPAVIKATDLPADHKESLLSGAPGD